jgi:hypothetical protein
MGNIWPLTQPRRIACEAAGGAEVSLGGNFVVLPVLIKRIGVTTYAKVQSGLFQQFPDHQILNYDLRRPQLHKIPSSIIFSTVAIFSFLRRK